MRDIGTFIVQPETPGLPAGNFNGYIDREPSYFVDHHLPFPHIRAEYRVTQCVLRVEREDHSDSFSSDDQHNYKDIDVTALWTKGVIAYDQCVVPDALKRKAS